MTQANDAGQPIHPASTPPNPSPSANTSALPRYRLTLFHESQTPDPTNLVHLFETHARLATDEAINRALALHREKQVDLLDTHFERAEHLVHQFAKKNVHATFEKITP